MEQADLENICWGQN